MACDCGINQVNAKVGRLNALWTFGLVMAILYSPYWWLCFVLLADFYIKGAFHPKFSPINRFWSWILKLVHEKPRPIFAPPKFFANKVGLAFSILISIFLLGGYFTAAEIFTAILGLFAFLEFAYEFCMGCWVYDLYYKLAGSDDRVGAKAQPKINS